MVPEISQKRDRSRVAAGFMLLAVIGFSLTPLLIAWGSGVSNPFLFNSGWRIGVVVGCLVFLAISFRKMVTDQQVWLTIRRRTISWALFFGTISYFERAFFAWSTQFIDISVTAILYEFWPLFVIFLTARLFRQEGRYQRITLRTLLLLLLCFIGFTFVVLSQVTGITEFQGQGLRRLALGVVLALFSAFLVSLTAFSFRWGADLAEELKQGDDDSKEPLELFGVVLGIVISSLVAIPSSALIGISSGEILSLNGLAISVLGGIFAGSFASIIWRKANLLTHNLGINAIAYLTPILALLWLLLASRVNVPRLDFLVIGTAAIVAANLLINFEAEIRFGFRSLLIALWMCGVTVYLRDNWAEFLAIDSWTWANATYFEALALSATVFTLLLAFRVARLVSRMSDEENRTFDLFERLAFLAERGVVKRDILERILIIDSSEQHPTALRAAYSEALTFISDAESGNNGLEEMQQLREARASLNALVYSKQHGVVFGELAALYIIATISVALALLARPDVSGWTAFLTDMFATMFAAVIVFLIFNVHDLQRDRIARILSRNRVTGRYEVAFRDIRSRAFEQSVSIIVGVALSIMYAWLLWGKWMG